jgi:hypothetical protein
MTAETFTLKSREEVARFEELLDSYVVARAQFSLKHISLTDAYDNLQGDLNGGRIFSALLDIQINFLLLYLDSNSVGATWNGYFSKGKFEGGSVLDSQAKFFGKMDIHRFNTAYVLRYRALWDKLMGLIVLMKAPNDYELFIGAKSRKKTFAKLAEKYKFAKPEFIAKLNDLLSRFDNTFRTSEAHGTGVLRKYSFTMESMAENPQIELIDFWNAMNGFLAEFGKQFSNTRATPKVSLKPPSDASQSPVGD